MSDRLLMLLPYWPPMGGPGVQRGAKLAKYLPQHGVEPFVVTRRQSAVEDASLTEDVQGVPVVAAWHIPFARTSSAPSPSSSQASGRRRGAAVAAIKTVRDWMNLPDHVMSWVPFAVRAGRQWAKEIHPTALFSTSPYHSTHLAGLALKRELGIPWIADFRDPWVGDLYTRYPTALHRAANERMERAVVGAADVVLTTTAALRAELLGRYPNARIEVVYNGFDPADFPAVVPPAKRAPPYTLRHMGTFYPDRKPDVFLCALGRLLRENAHAANRFRVEMVGSLDADVEHRLRTLVADQGIGHLVSFKPYVAHAEALTLLQNSDALLLVPGPGNRQIPGKLFEYLAAARPILTVAPRPSGVDEVYSRLGTASLRVEENEAEIADALDRLGAALERGDAQSLLPPASAVAQFTRPGAAARIAELIAELRTAAPPR